MIDDGLETVVYTTKKRTWITVHFLVWTSTTAIWTRRLSGQIEILYLSWLQLMSTKNKNQMPGYSGTPLAQKLGIKTGFRIKTKNPPSNYQKLLKPIPNEVAFSNRFRSEVDLWHLFTASRNELSQQLRIAQKQIRQNGMIWVSWPKKSSGIPSEITEDTIREIALPMGLVDVKVCAVDDTWSGLKLMIRKECRT